MPRRDSPKQDCFTLGGRRVAPLPKREKAALQASSGVAFDWQSFYESVRLGRDERVFLDSKRLGLSVIAIARHLGWTLQHGKAVQARVARALRNIDVERGHFEQSLHGEASLAISYRENLPGGGFAWSMASIEANFEEIIASERKTFLPQSVSRRKRDVLTGTCRNPILETGAQKMSDLEKTLREAELNVVRISDEHDLAREAVRL